MIINECLTPRQSRLCTAGSIPYYFFKYVAGLVLFCLYYSKVHRPTPVVRKELSISDHSKVKGSSRQT